jgi:hypothetical protein
VAALLMRDGWGHLHFQLAEEQRVAIARLVVIEQASRLGIRPTVLASTVRL